MRGGVMLKLGSREEIKPIFGVVSTEDPKVCVDFLIGMFCLSVCLGVVGSGEFDIILKESG